MNGRLAVTTACPAATAELLLIHGTSSSARYWGRNLGPLARSYRVVAPDVLGFGDSPKPDDSPYSAAAHADALARVVAGSRQPVLVVGHSLGALLALHLAVRYPSTVRGVVLIALPLFATAAEARRHYARSSPMARLQLRAAPLARAVCWLVCHARPLVEAVMPLVDRTVPPEVARDQVKHTWPSVSRTLRRVLLAGGTTALLDRIPAERLLLLHAQDDRVSPYDAVSTYARRRGVALVSFGDGGHQVYLRHRRAVCAAISAFAERMPHTPLVG